MTELFFRVVGLSVTVCVLAFAVLLFFGIFGKRFSAKCRYIVWSILIFRLLIPVSGFAAPVFNFTIPAERPVPHVNETFAETSLHDEPKEDSAEKTPVITPPITVETVFSESASAPAESLPSHSIITEDVQTTSRPVYVPAVSETDYVPKATDESVNIESAESPVTQSSGVKVPNSEPSVNNSVPLKNDKGKITVTLSGILDILTAVWLIGAAVCLCLKLGAYITYSNSLRREGVLCEPTEDMREIYAKAVSDMGLKRSPGLFISCEADSPMLAGFFRPKVLLSETSLEDEGIYRIIRHELTHYIRGDLWIKLVCAVVESLYWFNPIVRFVCAKCVDEMELSCDEAILAGLGEDERVSYGEAILSIVKKGKKKESSLTTSFFASGSSVKRRFEGIIDSGRKRKGTVIVALVLVMCIVSGSVFACSEENPEAADKNTETTAETEKTEDKDNSKEEDESDITSEPEDTDETVPVELEGLDSPVFVVKAYDCRDAYYDKPHLSSYGHEINYSVSFFPEINEGYKLSVCKISVCDDGCSDETIVGTAVSGYARVYDVEYLYELPADTAKYPIKAFKWSLPEAMYEEYPDGEDDPKISDAFRSTMYLVNVSENVRLVLKLDPEKDTPETEGERDLMDKIVCGVYARDSAESEGKHHRYERYIFNRSNVYIYDSDGKVVYEEYNDHSSVSVEERDGVVVINKGFGNGPLETRYYSIEKNVLSDTYYDVAAYDDGKVIYAEGSSGIVIKSIFDSSVYHFIQDRLDIKWRQCIQNAYFEDGKAVVEYRYFENDDSEESSVKTVVVELGKEDVTPDCDHSYVKQIETSATCVEDGSIHYVCEYCGSEAAYTEILTKTGHTVTAATCTSSAVCKVCGAETASAAGHDFAPATTAAPKTCKVCGVTEGWPAIVIDTSGALGEHQFSAIRLFYCSDNTRSPMVYYKYIAKTVRLTVNDIGYTVGEPDENGLYQVTFYGKTEKTYDDRGGLAITFTPKIYTKKQIEKEPSGVNGFIPTMDFGTEVDMDTSDGTFVSATTYLSGGHYTVEIKDNPPQMYPPVDYEPMEPLNIDLESFKKDASGDIKFTDVPPKSTDLSVCIKEDRDPDTNAFRGEEMMSAVRIDNVSYTIDDFDSFERYVVTLTFSGEVVYDSTDADTAYVNIVVNNDKKGIGYVREIPYSNFTAGSRVEGAVTLHLEGADYRIYFKNVTIQ